MLTARPLRVLVPLLLVGVAATMPSTASAASTIDFRTPDKAAYCDYVPQGEIIEGGVANPRPFLDCWTPNDGFFVTMFGRGKVHKGYSPDQLKDRYPAARRVLKFGKTWRRGGFHCISRSSGLTCRNTQEHGWRLGRFVGYTIY